MTQSLKAILDEQAASVDFKAPDLEAIARTGGRRIRRRRVVTVLSAVTAVVLVATTAAVLFGPGSQRQNVPVGPPTGPAVTGPRLGGAVSWALGTTIHVGEETVEVGHPVRAYVRTEVGFVTIDDANNVYSVTKRGVTRIGNAVAVTDDGTDHVRLYSDPQGTLAGWVGIDDSRLSMRVHDQATGQTRTYETDGDGPGSGAVFFAIDDRTAYWRTSSTAPVVAVDVDTDDQRQVASADQARDLRVWSVANGVLALSQNQPARGNATSVRVGRSLDNTREFTFAQNTEANDQILLSPTGAWMGYLLFEFNGPPQRDDVRAFTAVVRDTSTGEPVALRLPSGSSAFPVGWLDDTTVQVLVFAPNEVAMYRCLVPDGYCEGAAELAFAEIDGNNLVLPDGNWTGS